MKFLIDKQDLLEKLNQAAFFTSTKTISSSILQGVFIKTTQKELHFFSSNLSSFFHTKIKIDQDGQKEFIIEPKKTIEFLSFLPEGKVNIEIGEKQFVVSSKNNKGVFPLLPKEDFPFPPQTKEKGQIIKTSVFLKKLPLVLFSASDDEVRPALSGVNFLSNDEMVMVSTDGFRLSLVKTKKEIDMPSSIIPAGFLKELIKNLKNEQEIEMVYLEKEKIFLFKTSQAEFFSRTIDAEFPQFEKVIPVQKKTTITIDREEFLRGIKTVSVFARENSNIIILETKKNELIIRPRAEKEEESQAKTEITIEGEDQKIAFNYKFLIDFLNHAEEKNIIIELLRPDAPAVFKTEKNKDFLHIIMPVRIQE